MVMELYAKKGGRHTQPKITITRAGQIGLNSSCLDKFFKGKSYALFYCDKNRRKIGIKPLSRKEDTSFKISLSTKKTAGSISGHSFLKYSAIDFSKTRTFTPEWDERESMLVIDYS